MPITDQHLLTTTPPAFSASEAIAIAARHYGVQARVHPLVSERDQNFRLDADDGRRFTLKISNDAESWQVIDFQNQALMHVAETDPSIPLPRVVPALDGQMNCSVEKAGKTHFVRVLSWLEGTIVHDETANPVLARRMGRLLARLGLALKNFDHPGSNPPLLWDMKRAADLGILLDHVEEPGLRQRIAVTLDRFIHHSQPVLERLRTQVIHNDMNPGNVLRDTKRPDRIAGLIDFGDLVKSPLIIDLAVAAAYQLSDGDDPLGGALPMITGYNSTCPLQTAEMELLADLIRTRLITSLLINSYRVTLFPENREYLMISHDKAKNFLIKLERLKADEALMRIRSACTTG